jgi:hypothetical protein
MTEPTTGLLLELASRGDLKGFAATLASVPVHRLGALGKDGNFKKAIERLVPIATHGSTPLDRLTALALIGRADNTTQQKQVEIAAAAKAAVAVEPPPLDAEAQDKLKSEDRYYIAIVIARSRADWRLRYAAQALLNEGSIPKTRDPRDVRTAFTDLLFDGAADLSQAFQLLNSTVSSSLHHDPGTKEADLSRARRLTKLLPPIEDAVRRSTKDNGAELAESFNGLLRSLVFRYARPTGGKEADEAAAGVVDVVLSMLSTLLRTRFSLAGTTETYKTVGQAKYWFKTQTWPSSTKQSRQRLAQTLREAITMRAQMGNPSRELLAVLIQLTGDRRPVERQLITIAEQPGIPTEVQDWLRAGGLAPKQRFESAAAGEAGLRDADMLIATALIRADRLKHLVEQVDEASNGPDPGLQSASSFKQTVNFARALANDVAALGKRRSMALVGSPGEVVGSDPKRHKTFDGALIQTELVRIEAPGVEKVFPNRTSEVLIPAQVSEVEAKRK